MCCWDELKSLRAQSVGEVMRAVFRICGNESQPHRPANYSKSWLRPWQQRQAVIEIPPAKRFTTHLEN